MITKIISFVSLFFVFSAGFLFSQVNNDLNGDYYQDTSKIHIGFISRVDKDSIVLSWFPDNLKILKFGTNNGYYIERAIINADGSIGVYSRVNKDPVKKWQNDIWDKIINEKGEEKSKYERLAYSLINDEYKNKKNPDIKSEFDLMDNILIQKTSDSWALLFVAFSTGMSNIAAHGLGLRYTDKDIKIGQKYSYRLILNGSLEGYMVDTSYLEVEVSEFNYKKYQRTVNSIQGDGKIIVMLDDDEEIFAYNFEKSSDNGISFYRINKSPVIVNNISRIDSVKAVFADTNTINYKPYKYRVFGITNFSEEVFIGEVESMSKDLTPPSPPILETPLHISPEQVKLSWKMNINNSNDLSGFYIGRDTSREGPFQVINKQILNINEREYIDDSFIRGKTNYYVVIAVDTAQNSSNSYPRYVALIDSIPPSPPNWLTGEIDTNGVVTLILKKPVETDFMGFRILRANDPSHEFVSIIENFGVDTLNYSNDTLFYDTVSVETTTKYVYYKASALDYNYNESDLSSFIAIKRPDKIPPVCPVISDVLLSDSIVCLHFIRSFSKDVKHYTVFREDLNSKKTDSIGFANPFDSTFSDNKFIAGNTYKYFLVAVDSSDLISDNSIPYIVKTLRNLNRLPVNNLKAELVNNQKAIRLSWDYDSLNEDYFFVIYRDFQNAGLKRYSKVDKSKEFFVDENLTSKGEYKYAIKVFTKSNAESPFSEIIKIFF